MRGQLLKIWLYIFTGRRNFRPLVAIVYLTLPGSEVVDLGWFLALSSIMTLLIEIPTGYLADRIGYKPTLILGKVAMIASTICLIVGSGFWLYALANVLFSLALALRSGTLQGYVHDTLASHERDEQYGQVMSKMRGEVSLLSVAFIFGYPLVYKRAPELPFRIALGVDLIGLIVACVLKTPRVATHLADEKKAYRSMMSLIKEFFATPQLMVVVMLTALAWVYYLSHGNFREPYLLELGYPVAMIGLVMGLSRLFWFVFGRAVGAIDQQPTLRVLVVWDFLLLSGGFLLLALAPFPRYVMGVLCSVVMGYYYARSPLYTQQIIKLLPDRSYKATFLSIKGQIEGLLGVIFPVIVGYAMGVSFGWGYLLISGLFVVTGLLGWLVLTRLSKDQ